MTATRVVVTGLGATSPVGGDVSSTWAALLEGRSGASVLTEDWAEPLAGPGSRPPSPSIRPRCWTGSRPGGWTGRVSWH